MTEFDTKAEAELRRTLRFVDDLAPLSPSLNDLQHRPKSEPESKSPQRSRWIAVAAFALTILAGIPALFLMGDGDQQNVGGAPAPIAPRTTESPSTTTTVPPALQRLPLDGRPQDLGVDVVDFTTVIFPTSPEELRQATVWNTVKTNVGLYREEVCMTAKGHQVEMPRYLAVDFRRHAEMPDFELDAQYGVITGDSAEYTTPSPPPGADQDEVASWQSAFSECTDQWEQRVSTEFDQIVGPIISASAWWTHVQEVTDGEAMRAVTHQMLTCIADGGGPAVDNVEDLYSDQILQDSPSLREAEQTWETLADLILECSDGYNSLRQELLVPIRDQMRLEHAEALAQAEGFFDEVMVASGMTTLP